MPGANTGSQGQQRDGQRHLPAFVRGLALQAAGGGTTGEGHGLLYLTSLSLVFVPSAGYSPTLGVQKLLMPLPEVCCPLGRRSGRVLSLP